MFYTVIGFLKQNATRCCAPLSGLLLLGLCTPVSATLLFSEGFDYAVGQNLNNQFNTTSPANQWLKPNGPNGTTNVIVAGDVDYPTLPAVPGPNSLSVPRAAAGSNAETRINVPGRPYTRGAAPGAAPLFFSFTMKMTSWTSFAAAGADTKNDAAAKNATNRLGGNIAGFHGGAASTTTGMTVGTAFAAPILIRREIDYTQTGTDGTPGTQTGSYELGILKQFAAPTVPGPPVATDFATLDTAFDTSQSFGVGDVVFIVGAYDFVDSASGGTNDIARLWINPTPGSFSLETTPTITAPASALNLGSTLSIESFHVKGDTNTPGNVLVDNIRIGDTFADVIPAVPEPSTIAIVVIGLLGSACRRRRVG